MEYLALEFTYLCGSDMHALVFFQYTGNEDEIDRFIRFLEREREDHAEVRIREQRFSEAEIESFFKFKRTFPLYGSFDVDQMVKLSGTITIPIPENFNDSFHIWWEEVFDDTKFPEWQKVAERMEVVE